MQILSLGNSFAQDAQRYLHWIAEADGVKLDTFNLYIGACPLSRHYRNMLSERPDYTLEMNGKSTGFKVSLKEALLNRNWDVVTLQQVSHESTDYENYQPYLDQLAAYIRRCVPKAKIAIQQTWTYEKGSRNLQEKMGYQEPEEMFRDLEMAYKKAAEDIRADIVIPSGEVFLAMQAAGIEKLHRDTLHASLGLGRYALGLIWYAVLTGRDVQANGFTSFDEEISPEQIRIAKNCVEQVYKKYIN